MASEARNMFFFLSGATPSSPLPPISFLSAVAAALFSLFSWSLLVRWTGALVPRLDVYNIYEFTEN